MKKILFLGLLASTAWAGPRKPCDSCESCTAELAKPGAHVELKAELRSSKGVCVDITGAGAQFVGGGQTIMAKGTAVQVSADDVNLRRLKIEAGKRGVVVKGARVTLLGVDVQNANVGLEADGAEGLRLVRSKFNGRKVGVAFGLPQGKACPKGAKMRSPGAVLSKVTASGKNVGVAACEALPVIVDSTIEKSGVGLLVGKPKAGKGPGAKAPWDPCACNAGLDGVKPSTTLFFSSGCGGCEVHEGWLPEVRAQGYDIKLRPTGKENKAGMAAYDAYMRRCAPEVTDAIGIPGCVPNYACPASHAVFKRRGANDRLERDLSVSDASGQAEFAARCVAAAQSWFDDKKCVTHAIRGTALCGNSVDAKLGTKLTGAENTCAKVEGAELGCAACAK